MQKLVIFIAILLSNFLLACGFYPYGEDVRFHFFNPDYFSYQKYNSFYYSSLSFGDQSYYDDTKVFDSQNEELWRKYCNNKVSVEDITKVLWNYSFSDIHSNDGNSFIQYLFKTKDSEAINYLKFAKNCEFFNTWREDPWERNQNTVKVNRSSILNKAITSAHVVKRPEIKRRYAFLAIRLAFYNQDMKQINKIYDQYFSPDTSEDIIDSWALYFKAIAEKNQALKNIYFANVFAKCPDKRFVSWQYFNSKIAEKDVLNGTKNNIEKANISLLYGIYNPGKNLDNLKQIYTYNPKSEGLSFLVSREISKLEDWVYTPYYTLFDPSIESAQYWYGNESESESIQKVLKRSEIDRKYAVEVLKFINSVDISKVDNPDFWKFAKAELLLMTKNYKESLQQISKLEKSLSKDSKIRENLDQIKVLNLFANQTYGNAIIPENTKEIIIKNKNNRRFIFALGRELEYLGNTDDAALLYASIDHTFSENDYSTYNYVYYKSLKNNNKTYGDYFIEYFNYLDAVYTSEQLLSFIKKAKDTEGKTDLFSQNFKLNKSSVQALYDLLGTKYMRENKLNFALNTFQKLGKDYYDNQYSLWERKDHDAYNDVIFDENPFYHLKYTPDFIPEKEQFRLNKISITQKLIEYKNKAGNSKEKDRDYYYFLVANCYYNMSQYGNVWMMKRYFKGSQNFSFREDNEEFCSSNLAKFYYGKAFENAKTDQFKALCLRMQGRCENNRLDFEQDKKEDYFSHSDKYVDERLEKNSYYQKLKNNYPDQYEDMMSTCDFFTSYFKARR
jgi:major membrane immunogen (membrane-anchored lipoprotein)